MNHTTFANINDSTNSKLKELLVKYNVTNISKLRNRKQMISALKKVSKDITKLKEYNLVYPGNLKDTGLNKILKFYNITNINKLSKTQKLTKIGNIYKKVMKRVNGLVSANPDTLRQSLIKKSKSEIALNNMKVPDIRKKYPSLIGKQRIKKSEMIAIITDQRKFKKLKSDIKKLQDDIEDNVSKPVLTSATPKSYRSLMKEFRDRLDAITNQMGNLKYVDTGDIKTLTTLVDKIDNNISYPYTGLVKIDAVYKISEDTRRKTMIFEVNNANEEQIKNEASQRVENYLNTADVQSSAYTIYAGGQLTRLGASTLFDNLPLNKVEFRKLPYDIQCNNAIIENHCVIDYLETRKTSIRIARSLKALTKSEKFDFDMKSGNDTTGVKSENDNNLNNHDDKSAKSFTVKDLKEFLIANQVSFYIYDQWMNKRDEFHAGNNKPTLYFICGNGHLYPLTKQEHTILSKCATIDKSKFRIEECRVMEYDEIRWYADKNVKWFDGSFEYTDENQCGIDYREVGMDDEETVNSGYDTNNMKSDSVNSESNKKSILKFKLNKLITSDSTNSGTVKHILEVDEETHRCYELYKKCGIDMILTYKFNKHTPLFQIAEKFNLHSTILTTFDTPRAIFAGEPMFEGKYERYELNTIDKNKCYLNRMMTLKYIPVIKAGNTTLPFYLNTLNNSKCTLSDKMSEVSKKINKYNFYFVSYVGKKDLYDYFKIGICSGFRLHHFKEEIAKGYIKIDHYIVPTLVENPYAGLLEDMIDLIDDDMTIIKNLINKFIGKCQLFKSDGEYTDLKLDRFFTSKEEAPGNHVIIHDNLFATYKKITRSKRFSKSMLPLAHYVVDGAINMVIDKLEELTKEGHIKRIVKFKTDSITYCGTLPDDLDKNDIAGWKEEEPSMCKRVVSRRTLNNKRIKLNEIGTYTNTDGKTVDMSPEAKEKAVKDAIINGNILSDNYAGVGKTYYIMNTVIPAIKKHNKDAKILVCAVQHTTLAEYRNAFNQHDTKNMKSTNNAESGVEIATLALLQIKQHLFKQADYIIIDEVGLLTNIYWEFIWSKITWRQHIHAFGDRKQLKPVYHDISPLDNVNIRNIFDCHLTLKTNYRNNYTNKEYDAMINGTFVPTAFERKIIGRYSKVNVCFTNKTRHRINARYTKDINTYVYYIGEKSGKAERLAVEPGTKLLCKWNDLRVSNRNNQFFKGGIFNNMKFTVKELIYKNVIKSDGTLDKFNQKNNVEATHIIIIDEDGKDYKLNMHQFALGRFEHGYAITLYCAQGSSIPYEDLGIHEYQFMRKKIDRAIYTAFSRILLA